MKEEVRSIQQAPTTESDSRRISGYAVVWNSPSRVLRDKGVAFIETIERGAITDELLAKSDVKCLFNHNKESLLARSNKGEGTLSLELDEVGLRYAFDAPHTVDGDKVLELVRRGDIAGSSFKFATIGGTGVRYYKEAGVLHRAVDRVDYLGDVSPVIDPAYTETSVEARSWEAPEDKIEEPEKTEQREEGLTESAHIVHRILLCL